MPAPYVRFLNWAVKGQRFIFSQAERRVALFSIAFDRTRMDVTGEPAQTWAALNDITNFSFSPDGTEIVYDTVGDPHEDLWISKIDGSGRRRLVGGGLNRAPQRSPNGDEILFYSNRGGLYDVWLIHPDGSGLRQLTAVTTAGHEMQGCAWIDRGGRILASRQVGGPSILNPRMDLRLIDPPGLPGFASERGNFIFLAPPVNGVLLGWVDENFKSIVRYSLASGKPERLGITGRRPLWAPGSNRQLIYNRDAACYLYDLDLRREKKLFSVAPNQIYALQFQRGRPEALFHGDHPRRKLVDGPDEHFAVNAGSGDRYGIRGVPRLCFGQRSRTGSACVRTSDPHRAARFPEESDWGRIFGHPEVGTHSGAATIFGWEMLVGLRVRVHAGVSVKWGPSRRNV